MTRFSTVVNSPGNLIDSPPIEHPSDAMAVSGPDGRVRRLPVYSKGAVSISLAQRGHFEIVARSLFPKLEQGSAGNRASPRYAIKVLSSGQTIYRRCYSTHETTLAQALATAVTWMNARRIQGRWKY